VVFQALEFAPIPSGDDAFALNVPAKENIENQTYGRDN
jgi:hypothetical protein